MDVLVIAPHPDDEAIGCGGAICLHASKQQSVGAVFLTSGELGLKQLPKEKAWEIREAEARASAEILGISELEFLRCSDWHLGEQIEQAAQKLRPILERAAPELIYLPHEQEWHPDHHASLQIVKEALRSLSLARPCELRGYEVWTPLSNYDQALDISTVMERKLKALRAHQSQLEQWPYERAVTGLNQYRGAMAGRCDYAEVFQVIPL